LLPYKQASPSHLQLLFLPWPFYLNHLLPLKHILTSNEMINFPFLTIHPNCLLCCKKKEDQEGSSSEDVDKKSCFAWFHNQNLRDFDSFLAFCQLTGIFGK